MYRDDYVTIDKNLEQMFSTKKERPSKKNNKVSNKPKNKKKGLIVAIVAGVLALITAATVTIIHFAKKKNQNTGKTTSSISALEDMGTELEFPEQNKPKYGNVVSGSVDLDKIVEKNNKLYVDQENADKSKEVGNSSIDTKGDTLKVDSNGKVKDKTTGYEIKDGKTGSTIQTGNVNSNGTIPGYEYNEELDGTYEEKDDTENLVYADSNYYNEEGELLISKGDVLSKEALEYAKENLSTKPSKTTPSNTSSTSSETSTTNNGVVNKDGTYTINGITYLSKEDYQQCIIDNYEGYAIIDGIMQPMSSQKQVQKTK